MELVVIGNKTAGRLFSFAGAKCFEIEKNDDIKPVLGYLIQNKSKIGAIIVCSKEIAQDHFWVNRLQKLELPISFLPENEEDAQSSAQYLDEIATKAIGIKISSTKKS